DCRLLGSVLFDEELAAGDASGLRIGVVRDSVSEDVAPEVGSACEAAVEALRDGTGGEGREVSLPDLALSALAAILVINGESLAHATPEKLNQMSAELSPIARGTLKYRMLLPAAATVQANRMRTLMRRRLAALFAEVDVLAWPTVPAPAPPL